MLKLTHVQTVLTEEMIKELKRIAGTPITKDALSMAVEYFIVNKPKESVAGQPVAAPQAVPK